MSYTRHENYREKKSVQRFDGAILTELNLLFIRLDRMFALII